MKMESRNVFSLAAIVIAAIVFGMFLSGGFDLTQTVGADKPAASPEATPAAVNFLAPDFVGLAERVVPSVVSVRVTEFRSSGDEMPMDRFHFFFRQEPQEKDDEPIPRRSEGSGFFITASGEILTNNHVVEDADKIQVELVDGTTYDAKVVGTDPATDLALIRIEDGERQFPYLTLGDSKALRVGEWVMAAGNPLDMDHTITVGVVSGKGRALGLSDVSFENYIQTDAAINFGNSGGPLVNLRGEVVGINSAINARGQNLGFAIPVQTAIRILPQLREHGHVVRGYLGVTIQNIDPRTQEAFKLDSRDGALVNSVSEGSPAEDAGVVHGDVIVGVDGSPIKDTRTLIDTIAAMPPGRKVTLELRRNGEQESVDVVLGERNEETEGGMSQPGEPSAGDTAADRLGVNVTAIDARSRQMFGLDDDISGVVITRVHPDSPAGSENLMRGDVILEANGKKVRSPKDLQNEVGKVDQGDYIRLYIFRPRSGQSFFSILKLEE